MSSPMKTRPLFAGGKKVIELDEFFGLDAGRLKSGMLTNCNNVTVLSGGALTSILSERSINVDNGRVWNLSGVYTYYSKYDSSYETKVTSSWVYRNICPEDVMNYGDGYTAASRVLVADVGMPGKTENGYRNIVGAYLDGSTIYVLYDAVYNIIDQRREDEYSKVGDGFTAIFNSTYDEAEGKWAKVCTVTQLWLDVIEGDGSVKSSMLTAYLEEHKTLASKYDNATLVSTDGTTFKYANIDYIPYLGAGYSAYFDKVYEEIYPTLATDYRASSQLNGITKRIAKYSNRIEGADSFGALGEKLILLPDMKLLRYNSTNLWELSERSETIPIMNGALQHFERLFGFYGDKLYASVSGDCTDYTEGVNNLPVDAAWQTVTSDASGFTALASFDGKLVAFTEKSMMTVTGIDLPFDVTYIGAYGCARQESVCALDGWLYFASESGILRYNGSRVESISDSLPFALRYADAMITAQNGMVVVMLIEFDGVFLYNPQSDSWSRRDMNWLSAVIPHGSAGTILRKENGGYLPYRLFSDEGEFSFSIALPLGARKRICSIAVTAKLEPLSELTLTDRDGNELMHMDMIFGETVTRTCALRNAYSDCEDLYFGGKGRVTLLSVRVEYLPLANRLRIIR